MTKLTWLGFTECVLHASQHRGVTFGVVPVARPCHVVLRLSEWKYLVRPRPRYREMNPTRRQPRSAHHMCGRFSTLSREPF